MSYVNNARQIFMLLFPLILPADNIESEHSKRELKVELYY